MPVSFLPKSIRKSLRRSNRTTKRAIGAGVNYVYAVCPQAQVLREGLRRPKEHSVEKSGQFLKDAISELRKENWASGRHALACAMASARRDNALYGQFGAIFHQVPALLKDDAALKLLFRKRARAVGLSSLIETWWLWKIGQYDQVIDDHGVIERYSH